MITRGRHCHWMCNDLLPHPSRDARSDLHLFVLPLCVVRFGLPEAEDI